MARHFDAVDDHLTGSDFVIDNVDYTIFCWFNPDVTNNNGGLISFMNALNKNREDTIMRTNTSGTVHFFKRTLDGDTDADLVTTTTSFTTGAWQSVAAEYNDGLADLAQGALEIYFNGILEDDTPVDTNYNGGSDDGYFLGDESLANFEYDGGLAYCCYWETKLTATELGALNRGVNPFVIRNDLLKFMVVLWGNQSPELDLIGRKNATNLGSVKDTTHPSVELLGNYL